MDSRLVQWNLARASLLATHLDDQVQMKALKAMWPKGKPIPEPESIYTPISN